MVWAELILEVYPQVTRPHTTKRMDLDQNIYPREYEPV